MSWSLESFIGFYLFSCLIFGFEVGVKESLLYVFLITISIASTCKILLLKAFLVPALSAEQNLVVNQTSPLCLPEIRK